MADAGYTDQRLEDVLASAGMQALSYPEALLPSLPTPRETFLRRHFHRIIETMGNEVTRRFPKSIHAVTAEGFELKVVLFVLTLSMAAP